MRGLIMRGKTVASAVSLLLLSFLCVGQTMPAQVSKNQTFITNYSDYESMGINPANLAANKQEGKKVSFGLMQMGFTLFNGQLKRDLLHDGDIALLGDPSHWFDDILVE